MTRVVSLLLFMAGVVSADTPPAPAPAVLQEVAQRYCALLGEIFARHRETVAGYPAQYQADLKLLQDRVQKGGDLEGLLAVAQEVQRFAKALAAERDPFELVPELPPAALVEKPAELRALQDAYLKRHADAAALRAREVADLTTKYLARLEALQRELTIGNRIRDALAVRQEHARISKGATDDAIVQLAEKLLRESGGVAVREGPGADGSGTATEMVVIGRKPAWALWVLEDTSSFALEGSLVANPDIPDELTAEFTAQTGRGRIHGRCWVDNRVVNMRDRSWFGKAIVWRIPSVTNLNATIELQSTEISAGANYGPHAQLALFADKTLLKALNVPLMSRSATLRVQSSADDDGRCTLSWIQGKLNESAEVPANAVLRLVLGIAVNNPGEECDTAITLLRN